MFGLVTKATYDADMAAKDVEIAALREAHDTAVENEKTRRRLYLKLHEECAGVRLALKAAEVQLGQANARLAVLTTRGPGGRFVRPVIQSNGGGVRV